MQYIIKLLTLCILWLSLEACVRLTEEKDTPTVIDFTYKDFHSGQAIHGIKVAFNKISISRKYNIDTLITDHYGRISFAFQNEESYSYELVPCDSNYRSLMMESIKNGEKNIRTIILQ